MPPRLVDEPIFLTHQFGNENEIAVFDRRTGDTHLLTGVAWEGAAISSPAPGSIAGNDAVVAALRAAKLGDSRVPVGRVAIDAGIFALLN